MTFNKKLIIIIDKGEKIMTKLLNNFIAMALMLSLAACGGGGGGGAGGDTGGTGGGSTAGCTDSTANNYNSSATTDDGSCTYTSTGGNGNASYYGFSTSGTEISNSATVPSSASNVVLADAFYAEVVTASTNTANYALYQPTCPTSTARSYSMVLVTDTGGVNSVSVQFNSYSNTVKLYTHSYKTGSNTRANYQEVATTATMACSNGRMTVSGAFSAVMYSNSEMMIMKKGSDIYVGVSRSALRTTNIGDPTMFFDFFRYRKNGCTMSSCSVTSGSQGAFDTSGDLSGATSPVLSGTSSFDSTMYLYSNAEDFDSSNASYNTYHMYLEGAGNTGVAVVGNVTGSSGSKRVLISAMNGGTGTDDGSGTNHYYWTGVNGVLIGVEQ